MDPGWPDGPTAGPGDEIRMSAGFMATHSCDRHQTGSVKLTCFFVLRGAWGGTQKNMLLHCLSKIKYFGAEKLHFALATKKPSL